MQRIDIRRNTDEYILRYDWVHGTWDINKKWTWQSCRLVNQENWKEKKNDFKCWL